MASGTQIIAMTAMSWSGKFGVELTIDSVNGEKKSLRILVWLNTVRPVYENAHQVVMIDVQIKVEFNNIRFLCKYLPANLQVVMYGIHIYL